MSQGWFWVQESKLTCISSNGLYMQNSVSNSLSFPGFSWKSADKMPLAHTEPDLLPPSPQLQPIPTRFLVLDLQCRDTRTSESGRLDRGERFSRLYRLHWSTTKRQPDPHTLWRPWVGLIFEKLLICSRSRRRSNFPISKIAPRS